MKHEFDENIAIPSTFFWSNTNSWLPLPSSKYDAWRPPLTMKNVWVKVPAMTENNINLSLFINDSHQYYFSVSDSFFCVKFANSSTRRFL